MAANLDTVQFSLKGKNYNSLNMHVSVQKLLANRNKKQSYHSDKDQRKYKSQSLSHKPDRQIKIQYHKIDTGLTTLSSIRFLCTH
jgi:hypothetical protein